jgi:hypothetical protein
MVSRCEISIYKGCGLRSPNNRIIIHFQCTFITTSSVVILNIAMNISTVNETIAHAAGKAQRERGLSFQSFLLTLLVYGSIFILSVCLFSYLKDKNLNLLCVSHLIQKLRLIDHLERLVSRDAWWTLK